MEVIRNLGDRDHPPGPSVVTFGNFDGVHRGHRAIFERVVRDARDLGARSVVYTFDPHPLKVLAPERAPRAIGSLDERLDLIAGCGVDATVVAAFTEEYSRQEPEEFVEKVLAGDLGMREAVVGFNCRFGRGARGTTELLARMGDRLSFGVVTVEPFRAGGEPISSTRIRRLLQEGRVGAAEELLGRTYEIRGRVVHGRHRGKAIGFPTANLATAAEIVPAGGIYAVTARLGATAHLGVASLGTKPTFGREEFTIEVHILDFDADIYGEELSVGFVEWLREERAFPSVGALVEQIRADAAEARGRLTARGTGAAAREMEVP